jgi:hypothetical protein
MFCLVHGMERNTVFASGHNLKLYGLVDGARPSLLGPQCLFAVISCKRIYIIARSLSEDLVASTEDCNQHNRKRDKEIDTWGMLLSNWFWQVLFYRAVNISKYR